MKKDKEEINIKEKNCKRTTNIRKYFCFLAAICLYAVGFLAFHNMGKESAPCVFFTGAYPTQAEAEKILENSRTDDYYREVCFCWEGGLVSAENRELARSTRLRVTGLLGDSDLCLPYTEGLGEADKEGCILSEDACLELFGSRKAVGSTVHMLGKDYVVRGTANWKSPMAVIRPEDAQTVYTSAFIRKTGIETRKRAADNFLMSSNLSGVVVEEDWLFLAAMAALFFFPVILGCRILGEIRRSIKSRGANSDMIFCMFNLAALCLVMFFISRYFFLPEGWIPGRWSDFHFWSEKLAAVRESIRWYFLFPKTVIQVRRMFWAGVAVFCGIGAGFSVCHKN